MDATLTGTFPLRSYVDAWHDYMVRNMTVAYWCRTACFILVGVAIVATIMTVVSCFRFANAVDEDNGSAQTRWKICFAVSAISALAAIFLSFALAAFSIGYRAATPASAPTLLQTIEREAGVSIVSCEGDAGERLMQSDWQKSGYLRGELPARDTLIQCSTLGGDRKSVGTVWLLVPTGDNQFSLYENQE